MKQTSLRKLLRCLTILLLVNLSACSLWHSNTCNVEVKPSISICVNDDGPVVCNKTEGLTAIEMLKIDAVQLNTTCRF